MYGHRNVIESNLYSMNGHQNVIVGNLYLMAGQAYCECPEKQVNVFYPFK